MFDNNFGKVKQDLKKDVKESGQQIVWDKESVERALKSINEGFNLKHSPFHEGNDVDWRRGNISYKYNDWELEEIKKCKKDIIYFAQTYCKLMTDKGYQNVVLRDYQIDLLKMFQFNKENICLASRQVGKTTTTTIFLAWFLCFHFEKNCFFLANKNDTVVEIVDKTQKVVKYLPFFLKPGVLNKTQRSIVFDNGSRLKSQATTKKSSIGDTIHLLYVDEFAHIDANIQKDFWENVYPTLSSSKISRIILTSTANGRELFYQIYKGSQEKRNTFASKRIDYWQVPGRDDAWKAKEIENFGGGELGEKAFNQQYGNQFLDNASLLLGGKILERLEKGKKPYLFKIVDVFEEYNGDKEDNDKIKYADLRWRDNFDPNDIDQSDRFLFSVDTSEGDDGDSSVLNIFKVELKPGWEKFKIDPDVHELYHFFRLRQVGIFKSSLCEIPDFAKIIYHCLLDIHNAEFIKVVLEWNTYGSYLYEKINNLYGEDNENDDSYYVKFFHKNDSKVRKIGVKLRPGYKNLLCENLKTVLQNEYIDINEERSVEEAFGFGKNKNNTYSAQLGNDDIFITVVHAGAALDTQEYRDLVEDYFDELPMEIQNTIRLMLEQDEKEINDDMYDMFASTKREDLGDDEDTNDDDDWI